MIFLLQISCGLDFKNGGGGAAGLESLQSAVSQPGDSSAVQTAPCGLSASTRYNRIKNTIVSCQTCKVSILLVLLFILSGLSL